MAYQTGDNVLVMGDLFNYSRGSAQFNGVAVNTGLDLWFREGIVVPEPGVASILVISSVWAALVRRNCQKK